MSSKTRTFKRIGLFADPHSGHRVGLTPPGWQYKAEGWREKWRAIQAECWGWWTRRVSALRPFYAAFVLGDVVDGPGYRSGGTEQITTDRQVQVDIGCKALSYIKTPRWAFALGTPYHTGDVEDWEKDVADYFAGQSGTEIVEIGDHPFPIIDDVVFDLKHEPLSKPGREWTKANGLEPERITSMIWAKEHCRPDPDIVLRAHVHYYRHLDGFEEGTGKPWDVALLPALQAMGTRFGARRCSKVVNYGFCYVDINYPHRSRTIANATFSGGTMIYGNFTAIDLTSGSVIAYNAR